MSKSKKHQQLDQITLTFEGRNLFPPCYLEVYLNTDFQKEEFLGKTEKSNTKIHIFFKNFKVKYSFEIFEQLRIVLVNEIDGSKYEKILILARILRAHQQKMDLRFITKEKTSKANQPLISIQAGNIGIRSAEIGLYFLSVFSNVSYFIPSIYYTVSVSDIALPSKHHKEESKTIIKIKSEILSGFEIIWPEYTMNLSKVTGENDLERRLKVDFFMKNWIFSDTLLGNVFFNIADVIEGNRKNYEILSQTKEPIGKLYISKVKYHKKPSFLDYVFNGLDVSLLIACNFPLETSYFQTLLPYEQIIEALHLFINEYDAEKKLFFYGYGANFIEDNSMRFSLIQEKETYQEKEANQEMSSTEILLETYQNMKAKLSSPEKKKQPESSGKKNRGSHFKNEFTRLEVFKTINSKEGEESNEIYKTSSKSPRIPRGSLNEDVLQRYSSLKLKSTNSAYPKNYSFLEEMLLEMSEDLYLDYQKPRFSKVKFYIMVILISDNIESDELQKSFEVCVKLSLEFPFHVKFINMGTASQEKLKATLSLAYKSIGEFSKKIKNKGVGIIDMKTINAECEKIMTEISEKKTVSQDEWLELRKNKLRGAVYKGIPKYVVEHYYAENLIPIDAKIESFSLK